MVLFSGLPLLLALTWTVAPLEAQQRPDAGSLLPLLSNGTPDALAGSLRGYLLRALPDPLYESQPNWGHTKRGLRKEKKQGVWRRIKVTADNPANHLVFDVRNVQSPESGRLTFTAFIGLDARAEMQQQRWEAGVKVFDVSVRARFRFQLTLECEATARLEPSGLLLPDAVFRLRVVQSHLQYDHIVVEHIAGLGGEAARLFGDAIKNGLHQWHPALERDLLAKANAAIVKAGDTKEVRVSLAQLLKKPSNLKGPSKGGKVP
jgi:hypothetical protein